MMENLNSRGREKEFSLLETETENENEDRGIKAKLFDFFQVLKKNIILTVLIILVMSCFVSICHLSYQLSAVEDSHEQLSTAIKKIVSQFNGSASSDPQTKPQPQIFFNSTLWTTHGSCSKLQALTHQNNTKQYPVQKIYPLDSSGRTIELQVVCDFNLGNDGGGWTVIQRRVSGSKWGFFKNFQKYESGFGNLSGSFWIGLTNLHLLTSTLPQELRVEMEDWEGNKRFAQYEHFYVGNSLDMYRLSIGGFSGDAGDSLKNQNSMRFSTLDNDNDHDPNPKSSCAMFYHGGYWYNSCFESNLNGLYYEEQEIRNVTDGIIWGGWKGLKYSLKKVEMKIRDTT